MMPITRPRANLIDGWMRLAEAQRPKVERSFGRCCQLVRGFGRFSVVGASNRLWIVSSGARFSTRAACSRLCVAGLAIVIASTAPALDLSLPSGAVKTTEISRNPGVYPLPTGPWVEELGLPVDRVEGAVLMQAFRLEGSGFTTFQLIEPLRTQIENSGYRIILECMERGCGGFDFRFATRVLPPPDMYVQLTDYHFLSARDATSGDAVSVLASRDGASGYIQITRVGASGQTGGTNTNAKPLRAVVSPTVTGDLAELLETLGHAVLPGLDFGSGSTSLGDDPIPALDDLAVYLKANPARRVLFVGHTDATGSLEANQAVSMRRAQAVVTYLRNRHAIPAVQIGADGVGYLSPLTTNLTVEGREANRRVEAVLISTE